MKGRRRAGWFVSAFVYFSSSPLLSVDVHLLSFISMSSSLSISTGFSVSLLPILFCLFLGILLCLLHVCVFFVLHFVSIFFCVQPALFLFSLLLLLFQLPVLCVFFSLLSFSLPPLMVMIYNQIKQIRKLKYSVIPIL